MGPITNDEEAKAFLEYLNAPPESEENEILQAPKRRRRRKDSPPSDVLGEPPAGPRVSRREAKLIDFYTGIGIALMLIDATDGQIVLQGAPSRAHEVALICKEYPSIAKWVDAFLATSVWTTFIVGHGTMLFAIAAHHNLVPANMMSRFQPGAETAA